MCGSAPAAASSGQNGTDHTGGAVLGADGTVRSRLHAVAHAVRPPAVRLWRRELQRRAVDETLGAAGRSCLVLAPHPDDETLGVGALIARKRAAGTRVRVLVVTDGRGSHVSSVLDPDALAAVRRAIWRERGLMTSSRRSDRTKRRRALPAPWA